MECGPFPPRSPTRHPSPFRAPTGGVSVIGMVLAEKRDLPSVGDNVRRSAYGPLRPGKGPGLCALRESRA